MTTNSQTTRKERSLMEKFETHLEEEDHAPLTKKERLVVQVVFDWMNGRRKR